jgi:hypothetical protein
MRKVFVILVILLFAGTVYAFTDYDLERYESKGQMFNSPSPKAAPEKTDPNYTKDPHYWCDRARRVQKELESSQAADRIASAAWNAAQYRDAGPSVAAARAEAAATVARTDAELKKAELDEQNLQEDSRRLDIPAGWLRCQFE